jgi:hypothetical protein
VGLVVIRFDRSPLAVLASALADLLRDLIFLGRKRSNGVLFDPPFPISDKLLFPIFRRYRHVTPHFDVSVCTTSWLQLNGSQTVLL